MRDDLAFALRLADAADALTVPRFRSADLHVETKPDLTPVTDADRAVERAIRELVAAERAGESVFGEEEGDDGGERALDRRPDRRDAELPPRPARLGDARRARAGRRIVCAVVSAPALGHRWWAAAGEGAWRDGERIHVSAVARLADAAVACTYARDLAAVEQRVWHARGLGDFWQHVLVAEGALDGAVDAHLKVWDFTAVGLIVEEAGGRAGALDGGAARANEQFVSSNGAVHDELLELLR